MKIKFVVMLAAVTSLIALAVSPVMAQQSSSSTTQDSGGNSLRMSPVRSELSMDPGTSKEVLVYAQNLSDKPAQLQAVISDFEASKDETGEPLVILDNSYAKSHSLKRLAIVEPDVISLKPGERGSVNVKVTIPESARAGGYYGAVRFLPASQADSNDTGVAISTNVGSLILLRVNGDLIEKMSLASMDTRQKNKPGTLFNSNKGISVVTRFNNEGNVQLQPFGKIRVLDRDGKVIEEHSVNNTDPRGNVLPESIRRFETKLTKIGNFGKYTVEGNFGYGEGGKLISSKQTFWVVPTTYIIGAVVGLLVLGGIIFLIVKVIMLSKRGGSRGRRY